MSVSASWNVSLKKENVAEMKIVVVYECVEQTATVSSVCAGRNGDLLLRYFLHRGAVQSGRSRLRSARRIISTQHLEHNGLRRCRDRVWERNFRLYME